MSKTRCDICDRNFKNEESLEMHNKAIHTKSEIRKEKSKKPKKLVLTIIGIIILLFVVYLIGSYIFSPGEYDNFAKCITNSGAKFYGAYWCSHCNEQKEIFGKSKKYLPYIECSLPNRGGQTAECVEINIDSYPTWIFSDNSKFGYLTLAQLSEKTGCELTKN